MFYFRPLPKISELRFYFRKNSFHHDGESQIQIKRFALVRDGMRFVLKYLYNQNGLKLKIAIPTIFCWEITSSIKLNYAEIEWYDLDSELQFDIEQIENKKIDVLLVCDLFGIPNDLDKVRRWCKKKKIVLFVDHSHCLKSSFNPGPNEFLFQSLYKHYPISKGAYLTHFINKDLTNSYQKIKWENSFLGELIWLFKSLVVNLFGPMRYHKNNYDGAKIIDVIDSKTRFEKPPFYCHHLVKEKKDDLPNIENTYHFYEKLFNIFSKKFEFQYINLKFTNSHLFGIKFTKISDQKEVKNILMKLRLPVVMWPEKKYIKILPEGSRELVRNYIDKTLFVCSFYNSSMSKIRERRIMREAEKISG